MTDIRLGIEHQEKPDGRIASRISRSDRRRSARREATGIKIGVMAF